jgi:diguanylate cyclase (GGDEF)-like protein
VISRFRVRNGLEEEVRQAFLNRPHLVEKAAGFCGLSVLTDEADPSVFLLLTRWTDAESFRAWHHSEAHHDSHELIPRGLKLDASYTTLTIGNNILDPSGIKDFTDALEGQSVALSRWLTESDAVFALLLSSDGSILARNRASRRIFAPDMERNLGSSIWDYLTCSDVQVLRDRLLGAPSQFDGSLFLNLTDAQQHQVTLDVGLVGCGSTTLLIGTHERRNESNYQTEIQKLTNDLSLIVRDAVQQNRRLKEANETIDRLARIDALTGLANRRMLDETLQREIARASRQQESLSLIMGDLDHFKAINDQFGHLVGDQVLASTGSAFKSLSRPYDLAARYGGEEFVLLLPKTSAHNAISTAERIRIEIEKTTVPSCPRQITISLGLACWNAGETQDQFIGRADAALYRAKNNGRNRVELAANSLA